MLEESRDACSKTISIEIESGGHPKACEKLK